MIRKFQRSSIAVSLVLLAVFVAGCTYKQALVFLRDAAQVNLSYEREVTIAKNDGIIDAATEKDLLGYSLKIAQYDDAAISAAVNQHSAKGALANVDAAIATIDTEITTGLAGVKNEAKKNTFHAILLSIRGALVSVKALATK